MMWNALHHHFNIRDVINGTNWASGYTGTMRQHGKIVNDHSPSNLEIGDVAHYGPGTGAHVTMYIGGGMWFSHGSEAGPFKVGLNYRDDLHSIRRHI
jgi:cell wall-associated NlpC family hydrolase